MTTHSNLHFTYTRQTRHKKHLNRRATKLYKNRQTSTPNKYINKISKKEKKSYYT